MKNFLIAVAIILVVIIFGSCAANCGGSSDPGASMNWGKGYYYDSHSHTVERSIFN